MADNRPVSRRDSELESVGPERPEELFRRYFRPIVSFFIRHGLSVEESRDLAQETFLRVFRQKDSFRGESGLEPWMFQIASNLYKNTIRTRQAQKRDALEVPLSEVAGGLEAAAEVRSDSLATVLTGERKRVLREALRDLPPQMRRCVILRVEHDLKYKEIAQLMGVSIETVKAHLYQARQHLRNRLADYFTDAEF